MNPQFPVWYLGRWDGSRVSPFWGGWPGLLLALVVGTLIFAGMVLLATRTYRRKRRDR